MAQNGFLPPSDYITPPWPSLYWPVTDPATYGVFMYYPRGKCIDEICIYFGSKA